MFPVILNNYPSSVSLKQLKHFMQLISNGRFAQYDYGSTKNMELYMNRDPPLYDLKKVTVPTYVYYGKNDQLCQIEDVVAMCHDLSDNIGKYLVPKKEFNHMDFVIGRNARWLVFEHLIMVSKNFSTGKFHSQKQGSYSNDVNF